jgi:hypothetical protein
VGLVELFVVIAATVDQDVVLLVMQAMCSTETMLVYFLSYATLCIGYVDNNHLQDGYKTEEAIICSIQFSTLAVKVVLGISAILIVPHHIRVQRCFV